MAEGVKGFTVFRRFLAPSKRCQVTEVHVLSWTSRWGREERAEGLFWPQGPMAERAVTVMPSLWPPERAPSPTSAHGAELVLSHTQLQSSFLEPLEGSFVGLTSISWGPSVCWLYLGEQNLCPNELRSPRGGRMAIRVTERNMENVRWWQTELGEAGSGEGCRSSHTWTALPPSPLNHLLLLLSWSP